MSADDGIQKSIENVCQIIRSVKCTSDDKVDAYFTLFRYVLVISTWNKPQQLL